MSSPTISTVFRMSPRATWQKVLGRNPGLDHYAVAGQLEPTLSGTASLQRFGQVIVGDRARVPILAHSHVWPRARGGQFAGFTSSAYWFDAATGGLMSSCDYADNRGGLAVYMGRSPWDWTVNETAALVLPIHPITVDFAQNEVYFGSEWVACRRAAATMGGTGQSSAYDMGPLYQPSGLSIERRVTVETGGVPGLVAYKYTTRTSFEEQADREPLVESVTFWVHTSQYWVQHVDCELAVVEVGDDRQHRWIQQRTRWTRLT